MVLLADVHRIRADGRMYQHKSAKRSAAVVVRAIA